MGRPKEHHEKRIGTCIRLPESVHNRLVEAAKERDLPVNYLVNRAIEQFLDRLIPVEEFTLTRDPPPKQTDR